jgi:hypothetical protein
MKTDKPGWLTTAIKTIAPAALLLAAGCGTVSPGGSKTAALRDALTFHAPFDGGVDARFAKGDAKLYNAKSMSHPRVGTPGLPANGPVTIAQGEGRFGDALRFHRKVPDMVFFKTKDNLPYAQGEWHGTVSHWLRVDTETGLAPGFADPVQITSRDWNDASFFVDFSKDDQPRHFRLGAFADRSVWDPKKRNWDDVPPAERPMVTVTKPPFRADRWTHVVFTFDHFNTGRKDGVAKLYLDGQLQGSLTGPEATFTWKIEDSLIMLGLSYVGLLDELAIFNRALSDAEVGQLYRLENGVAGLLK